MAAGQPSSATADHILPDSYILFLSGVTDLLTTRLSLLGQRAAVRFRHSRAHRLSDVPPAPPSHEEMLETSCAATSMPHEFDDNGAPERSARLMRSPADEQAAACALASGTRSNAQGVRSARMHALLSTESAPLLERSAKGPPPCTEHGIVPADRSAPSAPHDEALAAQSLASHATLEHSGAAHDLGVSLLEGLGGSTDAERGLYWLERAAGLGHVRACCVLASAHFGDYGVPRDEAAAVQWLTRAAELGHAEAQHLLAACYEHGRGVQIDANAALRWLGAAASRGHAVAARTLAQRAVTGACSTALASAPAQQCPQQGTAQSASLDKAGDEPAGGPFGPSTRARQPGAAASRPAALWRGTTCAAPKPNDDERTNRSACLAHSIRTLVAASSGNVRSDVHDEEAALRARVTAELVLAQLAASPDVARAHCLGCGLGASAAARAGVPLHRCASCHVARFCSRACQARVWAVHKPTCRHWAASASMDTREDKV